MGSKCEETNRQTRKGSKYFALCLSLILFLTFIPCHHRRLLLAAFFLIHARMCGIHKQHKGFFEINEWHWLLNFWKETISFAAHFASIHFISFIHLLRLFFIFFHFYNRFSKAHNTAHVPIDRHSFGQLLLIARTWSFVCGRFEWQKCRNQTKYEHVFFLILTSAKTFGPSSVLFIEFILTLNTSTVDIM